MKIKSIIHPIPSICKTDDIGKAVEIFIHYKVNAIPIVDNQKIVGELTILSVLEKMAEKRLDVTVEQLEIKEIKVSSKNSISTARKKFKEYQIDALPVENEKEITQIITSNDIILSLNPPERVGTRGTKGKTKIRSLGHEIGNIGRDAFPRCSSHDSIGFALNVMVRQKNRFCVIDFSPTKHGFITAHDIIGIGYNKTKKEIPIYIVGSYDNRIFRETLSKLESPLEKFSKSVENILETRISIEEQKTKGLETKYNLKLLIITEKNQLSFSTKTWSIDEGLTNFAEIISEKNSSRKKKSRKSIRKTSKVEILAKGLH